MQTIEILAPKLRCITDSPHTCMRVSAPRKTDCAPAAGTMMRSNLSSTPEGRRLDQRQLAHRVAGSF